MKCHLFYLVVFLSLFVTNNESQACDCTYLIGLKEAKAVFTCEVLSIKRIEQPYIFYEVRVRIKEVFKSNEKCVADKELILSVPSLEVGGCGIPFEIQQQYIIYAYVEDGKLWSDACTNTRRIIVP